MCLRSRVGWSRASAQGVDSDFRASLSADLLRHERVTFEQEFGEDSTSETTTFGVLSPRLGIDLAIPAHEMVLIGATAAFAFTEVGDADVIQWSALPWVELALLPGESIRPYFRAIVGASGYDTSSESGGGSSLTYFSPGASLGVHFFPAGDVSLDSALTALYRVGDLRSDGGFRDVSLPAEGFEISLSIGISAWIGGRSNESSLEAIIEEEGVAVTRRATPSVPTFRVEEGALELDLASAGQTVGRLRSRPRENGRDVELDLIRAPGAASMSSCASATLVSERGRATVPMRVSTTMSGDRETVTITATAEQLELLTSSGAIIEGCTTSIALDATTRASFINYLTRFRSAAAQYGTRGRGPAVVAPTVSAPAPEAAPTSPSTEAVESPEVTTSP